MSCLVCSSAHTDLKFFKSKIEYFLCSDCGAVYCEHIPASLILTENSDPDGRAELDRQEIRIERIHAALGRRTRSLLDFGCGRGAFVDFARSQGIESLGVDQHTKLQLPDLAGKLFDAMTVIEVIEHLPDPVSTFGQLVSLLRPDGVIYGESSFVDFFPDIREAPYIDPAIGHRCVFSRKAVGLLASRFSLETTWLNNNVFLLRHPAPLRLRVLNTAKAGLALLRRRNGAALNWRRKASRIRGAVDFGSGDDSPGDGLRAR